MKKVAMFIVEGFEEVEGLTVVDYLRRVGVNIDMISVKDETIVNGAHNIQIKADRLFKDINGISDYDMYVLPGGSVSAKLMRGEQKLLDFIKSAFDAGKDVAAICAAPTVLYDAGILQGKNITSYPGVFRDGQKGFNYVEENVVIDGNLITSRGPAIAVHFALALVEYIAGEKRRKELEKELLYDLM